MLKQISTLTVAGVFATAAYAGPSYEFTGITNNNPADVAIGEAQFSVEVKDTAGLAEFIFNNTGPDASSMVQLYWEDNAGVLSSLDAWDTTSAGVDYTGLGSANPGHLPGSSPKINDFSTDPSNPGGKANNGVGPGEDVSIFFSYSSSFQDIIAALDSGDLIIGVHGQSFDGGGSESFVTGDTPSTVIPSPTAALAGLAMLGLVAGRRRRRD